ncbi:hypothetical protein ONA70_29025 [Micromonospora yasonensis]|uniref:hypothetical protein n=1 Tax=Micromonospora yasonensis TaxID=1128667 RepID=UPI002231619C|nr:hypothetical protein [Micromonospora yasonensis]MCW3844141.1 hypothetical protein [Micromonospora yasonensis]
MNEILDPPAERDLPPTVARKMRAQLLRSAGRRAAHRPRLRLAVIASMLLVVMSGVTAMVWDAPDGRDVQVLAIGPGELSPTLRDAAEQCLRWHASEEKRHAAEGKPAVALSLADLSVATERGDHALVLFMNDVGYATCDLRSAGRNREVSGGISADPWPHGKWLPGPVQKLLLTSTEHDGGDVSASGRVSERVQRLVLDHGNGHTTTARLSGGAFGLMTADARLKADENPQLVSYDKRGVEIDRRPLFQPEDQLDHCYTTPSGKLIYGKPSGTCRQAEAWKR